MTRLTRDDVARIVSDARERGKRPNLAGADFTGADLRFVDLTRVNLRGAHLQNADLRNTNLCSANLRGAHLRDANLTGAHLRDANLRGAELRYAKFAGADLRGADLTGAHLPSADLTRSTGLPVLTITGLVGERVILLPIPDGWQLHVGDWTGTPDTLRELNATFDNNRPLHTAVADLADAFIAAHPVPHVANPEKDPHHA